MKNFTIGLFLFLITTCQITAQEEAKNKEEQDEEKGFRIVGIIGHTLINNESLDNVFVPSWGLDVEYWFNNKWGVGFHNDVEIETFTSKNSDDEEVERVNPVVLTLDMLYNFGNGIVVTLGPGIELEKEESFFLWRVGVEYEKDINESFYLLPNLSMDQRFDGYITWNIGLGVGIRL